MDNAVDGVILISWGSNLNTSTLPADKVQAILRALATVRQTVVWKWENSALPDRPKNVHILNWIPQRDILEHPNVKLFWTHGGNLGTSEAVHCGVPMIVTPFYGDQFVNGAAVVKRGMAVVLDYSDITTEMVRDCIKRILENSQ